MAKNASHINRELALLTDGGKVYLPVGTYEIDESIRIDTPCIKLEGEVWNYSSDPNGVFESRYGTKLRLKKNDIPAIRVGVDHVMGGNIVKDIGIQGNISGMDTRGLFDYSNPTACAGLCLDSRRVDQAEFGKLSFCGLGTAVCAAGAAEIDACTFEKLNADGCCMGIYFAPLASYYTTFKNCIVADNPRYGFFARGENSTMHNICISNMKFVRNGGAFPVDNPYPKAAVCLYHVSDFTLSSNVFDCAGTFWYYEDDATENTQRKPQVQPVPALWVEGNENKIIGNKFSHCSSDAIVINGDHNIIMNNILDKNIIINGDHNIISNNIFTDPDSKIVIGEHSHGTELINIPENRIVRK